MSTEPKLLKEALAEVAREYGVGAVMRLGDRPAQQVEVIPTGALSLDLALGVGGMPRGRIVEIFGPESSGKTTLVYHVLAEAQRRGGRCAFIDAEHSLDPDYAKAIGVQVDDLLFHQPDFGEQALDIADRLVRSEEIAVIAIDSVAALTPKAELENSVGHPTVGLQARMMSQALRRLAAALSKTNTLCILTNQIREKIGVFYGSPETQPGGRALKFYATQRLDVRRIETLKDGSESVGNRVRVKVVKNKVAPPFRQAEFDIDFGVGISTVGCLLDVALEQGIVEKSGQSFAWGEEKLGRGRAAAKRYLTENPVIAIGIDTEIRDHLLGQPGAEIASVVPETGANVTATPPGEDAPAAENAAEQRPALVALPDPEPVATIAPPAEVAVPAVVAAVTPQDAAHVTATARVEHGPPASTVADPGLSAGQGLGTHALPGAQPPPAAASPAEGAVPGLPAAAAAGPAPAPPDAIAVPAVAVAPPAAQQSAAPAVDEFPVDAFPAAAV